MPYNALTSFLKDRKFGYRLLISTFFMDWYSQISKTISHHLFVPFVDVSTTLKISSAALSKVQDITCFSSFPMSFCNITNEMALFRKVKSLFKREPLSYYTICKSIQNWLLGVLKNILQINRSRFSYQCDLSKYHAEMKFEPFFR